MSGTIFKNVTPVVHPDDDIAAHHVPRVPPKDSTTFNISNAPDATIDQSGLKTNTDMSLEESTTTGKDDTSPIYVSFTSYTFSPFAALNFFLIHLKLSSRRKTLKAQ